MLNGEIGKDTLVDFRRVKNRSDLIEVFKVIKRFFIVLDCGWKSTRGHITKFVNI